MRPAPSQWCLIPRDNPGRSNKLAGVATRVRQRLRGCVCWAWLMLAIAFLARAREPLQPLQAGDAQQNNSGQQPLESQQAVATLHGVVRNGATGDPLPRALVAIEGQPGTGALTDGDGRFEIPNLAAGPVVVQVQKPGFLDNQGSGATVALDSFAAVPHNVMLAAGMPDVEFTLVPCGAIRGQIGLGSGEPAGGFTLNLLRRELMAGRASWAMAASAKTRSDGSFRFGDLAPGVYELYTEPSLESENMNLPIEAGRGSATQEWGFATVYYPDARTPSGASRITVEAGETVQANMIMMREAFQPVTAVAVPPTALAGQSLDYEVQVTDIAGRALPYPARYDPNSKTLQASLPDGSYRLSVITSTRQRMFTFSDSPSVMPGGLLEGAVDLQVAGQPVNNLRVALTAVPSTQVQVNVLRSNGGAPATGESQIMVTVTQASTSPDQIPDQNMTAEFASGQLPGPLEGQALSPGAYWVHTFVGQRDYCESSFTAGGANLAREPLLVGPGGAPAPLELTLRDDCARLTLSLPETIDGMQPGEEKFYTVYAIPDFDSTDEPQEVTLRPSTGGTITLEGLTPGSYHVYTLQGNAPLEYRNPAVLAALPSQAVTLAPGATADVVVNVSGGEGAASSE